MARHRALSALLYRQPAGTPTHSSASHPNHRLRIRCRHPASHATGLTRTLTVSLAHSHLHKTTRRRFLSAPSRRIKARRFLRLPANPSARQKVLMSQRHRPRLLSPPTKNLQEVQNHQLLRSPANLPHPSYPSGTSFLALTPSARPSRSLLPQVDMAARVPLAMRLPRSPRLHPQVLPCRRNRTWSEAIPLARRLTTLTRRSLIGTSPLLRQ
jgi:hypothetical protein